MSTAIDAHFLTTEGVADLFDVKPVTVRRWIAAGHLPVVKIGNVVRIRREDVDAFVAAHRSRRSVTAA